MTMKRKGPRKPADPLKLSCTKADCSKGLHALRPSKEMIAAGKEGECLACHEKILDFSVTRKRDLSDVQNTFALMKKEYVRHWFWTSPLNEKARDRAMRKGRAGTEAEMEKRLRTAVGPAQPFHDGFQTPLHDPKNVVYWAQHATASCCRRCMEYWHGIERGHELTEEEIGYLKTLAMRFIDEKLPELGGGTNNKAGGSSSSSSSSSENAESQ
jgi:hypothetical protein